jgi:hypothetical protein
MSGRLLTAALAAAVMLVVSAAPAPADTADPDAADSTSAAAASWTLRDRFSREVVRPGDADVDTYHIEHVYELQYRLQWRGLFHATPTGYYGPVTKAAVREFQRRNDIPQTGVVGYRTWRLLIPRTVRGRGDVPPYCFGPGWRACYDRSRHQVNLYHDGLLWNSWLVRGGAYDTPTRTGKFEVYYRDIDHVSAQFDDAPMPYSQFFSGGQALHGSRLMMNPFVGHSHGCVNFWVEDARQLWNLTAAGPLRVRVYGAWS